MTCVNAGFSQAPPTQLYHWRTAYREGCDLINLILSFSVSVGENILMTAMFLKAANHEILLDSLSFRQIKYSVVIIVIGDSHNHCA